MCDHDWRLTDRYLLLSPKIQVRVCARCGAQGRVYGRFDAHGREVFDGPVEDVMEAERLESTMREVC